MPRIAILGGGLAGLTAAYELEQHRRVGAPLDWHLYEASTRLGGLLSTTRLHTPEGDFLLEDGPDGWLTEKPAARDLALDLGLAADLLPCNEPTRRTLLYLHNQLTPMPPRMRLMVPQDLAAIENSPLFSPEAKRAYAAELTRSAELKSTAPTHDESVATFVRRHFGHEVLTTLAAPLLAGVFGGDVEQLSVRAVMPAFVAMEREHGSLIAALQTKTRNRAETREPTPTFTTLRHGMGSLAEALIAALPADRLHAETPITALTRDTGGHWLLHAANPNPPSNIAFHHLLLATPPHITRQLVGPLDPAAADLIPSHTSSAVLVTLCWPAALAQTLTIPQGFGFLVPPNIHSTGPQLLAATFAHQKYPHRAPPGARILRAFFGTGAAEQLHPQPDEHIAQLALANLRGILGPLPPPDPTLTTVRRWPRSLPQYAVGHLDRLAELNRRTQALGHLHLLGNGYHGVGLPDIIRHARATAAALANDFRAEPPAAFQTRGACAPPRIIGA